MKEKIIAIQIDFDQVLYISLGLITYTLNTERTEKGI